MQSLLPLLLFTSVVQSNEIRIRSTGPSDGSRLLRRAVADIVGSNDILELVVLGTQKTYSDTGENVMDLLQGLNVPLVFINFNRNPHKFTVRHASSMILVYLPTLHQSVFETYMTYMQDNVKPRTKFVLVTKHCIDQDHLGKAFEALWRALMINSVIAQQCNDIAAIHTYFPYANRKCGVYSARNIMQLGYYQATSNSAIAYVAGKSVSNASLQYNVYYNTEPFYPAKVPLNLNQCAFNVGVTKWPPLVIDVVDKNEAGLEMEFLFIVERALNCRNNYNTSMTWHMAQPFLKDQKVSMVIGALYLHPLYVDFDNSHWYYRNELMWISPKAPQYPNTGVLLALIESQYGVFASFAAFVPITALAIYIVIEVMHRLEMYVNLASQRISYLRICAQLARTIIDSTTSRIPSITSVRLCFGLWNLNCVIISCFFQTTLTSFLSEPGLMNQIDTVDAIIASDLDVSVSIGYKSTIQLLYGPKLNAIIDYNPTHDISFAVRSALKRVSMNKAITFTDKMRAEYISLQWIKSDGREPVFFMYKAPHFIYWIQFTMTPGHPMFERINDLVLRSGSLGFWNKQMQRYLTRRKIRTIIRRQIIIYNQERGRDNEQAMHNFNNEFSENDSVNSATESTEYDIIDQFVVKQSQYLSIEHLYSALKMYLIGITLASCVFLIELLSTTTAIKPIFLLRPSH